MLFMCSKVSFESLEGLALYSVKDMLPPEEFGLGEEPLTSLAVPLVDTGTASGSFNDGMTKVVVVWGERTEGGLRKRVRPKFASYRSRPIFLWSFGVGVGGIGRRVKNKGPRFPTPPESGDELSMHRG